MAKRDDASNELEFDISDVKRRVGQRVGGGELLDPCSKNDIRRWVQGMDYANPLHWDAEFAANTKFGGIVAPQSFAVGMDWGDGISPSLVGHIPGSHMLFGGEEWWFYGHVIRPGDQLFQERRLHDYKETESKFAGPTLIERGDTIHRTQNGTLVAKQRGTSIRYLAAEAEKRKMFAANNKNPVWTKEELAKVAKVRRDWLMSNRDGKSPHFEEVSVGDKFPRRAMGPHSIASIATEWRAFNFTVWGAFKWVGVPGKKDKDVWINNDSGFTLTTDWEDGKIDPRGIDGLYSGPASGHVNASTGAEIGLPRVYGYGATMGAWVTDYLAFWAGHDGMVRHSKVAFKTPYFEGDVTYMDAEVIEKITESEWGVPLVKVKVEITNQDGTVLVGGTAEIELPHKG
jgi:acyl dehydratase